MKTRELENAVRILLVEDSRVIRRENQTALMNAGYEVMCAEDGEAALSMARELSPELILLDMIIPKINGPEVLKQLKKDPKTSQIPVVVVSSLSDKNRDKLIEVGAEEFLEKNELMPSRGVNLLPERLEPIIRQINNRKGASNQDPSNDSEEDILEIGDLEEFEELNKTE